MPAKDDLDDLEAKCVFFFCGLRSAHGRTDARRLLASLEGKPDAVDEAKRALACVFLLAVAVGAAI